MTATNKFNILEYAIYKRLDIVFSFVFNKNISIRLLPTYLMFIYVIILNVTH